MNNTIFFFFYNLSHKSELFDKVVYFTAVYFPFIVVALAFFFLLFYHNVLPSENPLKEFLKKWKEILSVFLSGIVAWLLALVLKIIFHAPRPFLVFSNVHPLFLKNTFSFPSEHAMFFSALTFELFLFHKKAGYVFMFFALLIGIARIICGVHFPIDILWGFILGALVAFFIKNV